MWNGEVQLIPDIRYTCYDTWHFRWEHTYNAVLAAREGM
jgi:hypothetical protein